MERKMKTRNILLLTATITPKAGVPNLKRVDPSVRLQDYKTALEYYLAGINIFCDGIIFAENSNSDISILKNLVNERGLTNQVEFISTDGLDYPPSYDRGYGEFKLIDYAMAHSNLIQSQQAVRTVVWKCTGRYTIKNIFKFIQHQPSSFDVYCNCRNYPKRWVDTYLMAWTPQAYQTVFNEVYDKLKLNVSGVPPKAAAEEILRGHVDLWLRDLKIVPRLKMTPSIEGARAADNKGYSTDSLWKFHLRSTANKVLPWLWV
jgi:hypothetical protein